VSEPTTELVRDTFAAMRARVPSQHIASAKAEFDTWLRQVKAEAWSEGWNASAEYMSDAYVGPDDYPNPYSDAP